MKRVEQLAELQAAVAAKQAVVLFHATWCPFCRRFLPAFVEGTRDLQGREVIEAVLDDEDNPLWNEHRIELVPTVLFFEDGKVVKRLDGKPGIGLTAEHLAQAL